MNWICSEDSAAVSVPQSPHRICSILSDLFKWSDVLLSPWRGYCKISHAKGMRLGEDCSTSNHSQTGLYAQEFRIVKGNKLRPCTRFIHKSQWLLRSSFIYSTLSDGPFIATIAPFKVLVLTAYNTGLAPTLQGMHFLHPFQPSLRSCNFKLTIIYHS